MFWFFLLVTPQVLEVVESGIMLCLAGQNCAKLSGWYPLLHFHESVMACYISVFTRAATAGIAKDYMLGTVTQTKLC